MSVAALILSLYVSFVSVLAIWKCTPVQIKTYQATTIITILIVCVVHIW
jgi:hypothetical protein